MNVVDFIENNKQIRVNPTFDVWMNMSEAERKTPIVKNIGDITCDEFDMGLEGGSTRELLERLKVSDVFAEGESESITESFLKGTLARCDENHHEFIKYHNAMADGEEYRYWRKMTDEDVCDDLTLLKRNGEIIEVDFAEQIKSVIIKRHPICIAADGLPVLDDVGGIAADIAVYF